MYNITEVIITGVEDSILDHIQLRVDAALTAVEEVATIIKEVAVLDEKDVNGEQIKHKKPKPSVHPKNLPNAQLIGEPDKHPISMLDPSRFATERTGQFEAAMTYTPPDYFEFVIAKRPWLTPDTMNDDARHRIELIMRERAEQ